MIERRNQTALRQMCSALLYIVNPDDYEPITSDRSDKNKIVEHYTNSFGISSTDNLDKDIKIIRD